jgi:hypothetical protein
VHLPPLLYLHWNTLIIHPYCKALLGKVQPVSIQAELRELAEYSFAHKSSTLETFKLLELVANYYAKKVSVQTIQSYLRTYKHPFQVSITTRALGGTILKQLTRKTPAYRAKDMIFLHRPTKHLDTALLGLAKLPSFTGAAMNIRELFK